jgi:hypothetical protein
MGEQRKKKTNRLDATGPKTDAKRTYGRPFVQTERPTEAVVLAASSGCGTAIDEQSGCDFAV